MRTLSAHKTNPANKELTITVVDEPGAGGASHRYDISGFDSTNNPSKSNSVPAGRAVVLFQNGPIGEVGVNGVTQEALLAIVIDRLQSFQNGPYACRENALALTKCEEALHWLQHRTLARVARGVEGTHEK
jgi:hypothetical protein